MPQLQILILGGFEVRLGGEVKRGFESSKVRALLAYLAAESGRPHRREALAGLLWPDWPQQSAMSNLRYALADLRKNIGDREAQPPFLLISRESLQLNPAAELWVDVREFESLLGDEGTDEAAREHLKQKIELYQGAFLAGFSLADSALFEEWQTVKREQLQREMMASLEQLTAIYAVQAEYETALLYARKLVELEPWLEEGHRQVMRLLALNGQRGAALSQYETCRAALEKELGVQPGAETEWVYESIREGKLDRIRYQIDEAGKTLPPEPGEPPFKGLQYFDVPDSGLFYGREALTVRLVGHIRRMVEVGTDKPESCCFLSVVGASGSGKSSVVRAGVVPALQRGEALADGSLPPPGSSSWHIHVFTPTVHPLEALAVSLTMDEPVSSTAELLDSLTQDERSLHLYAQRLLAPQEADLRGKCRLLLVVDQFEELFTLCRSEAERTKFVNNLLMAVRGGGPTQVIVVLRADFYGHCAQYPLLREALCVRQEYIGPMTETELRSAIEQPAEKNNWRYEPGLVELILRDVGDEPGALPLLEHALLETWQRRSGRTLTVQGYADSGGVHGAIAKTAESVYAGLSEEQQELARRIFLRLTELGEGTQDTRRRVSLTELAPGDAKASVIEGLLKKLADARLITLAEGTAEVAHEALIREWPALRSWLSEDREGLRLHRHLTESAGAWSELDRDTGELYRGARLQQALEWAAGHEADLNDLEREFLQASEEHAEAEAREREARRQRELEAAQRLARTQRQRSIVLSIGLAVAVVLIGVALWLNSVANDNLDLARNAEMTAQSEAYSRATQEQRALLEADQRATQAAIADEARQVAEDETALSRSRELAAAAVSSLIQDPQLSLLLALQAYHTADTREAEVALHQAVQASHLQKVLTSDPELMGDFGTLTNIAYSLDGRLLAAINDQDHLQVFDIAEGELLYAYTLDEIMGALQRVNDLIGAGEEIANAVWNIQLEFTPDDQLVMEGYHWFVILEAGSGQELYRGISGSEGVSVVDSHSGEEVLNVPITRDPDLPIFVEYTSAGSHVLFYSQEQSLDIGDLTIVNLRTGAEVNAFSWQNSPETQYTLDRIEYSPNGDLMAWTPRLGVFEVWDLAVQRRVAALRGMPSVSIAKIAFSPDSTYLLARGVDGTIKVWDIADEKEVLNLSGTDAFFSADSTKLVVTDASSQNYVWHILSNRELYHFLCHPLQVASALSPDGAQLAAGGSDGSIHLCGVTPDYEDHVWVSEHPLVGYGYARQPGLLAIASADNAVHFFDSETGEPYKNHYLSPDAKLVDFKFNSPGLIFYTVEENFTVRKKRVYYGRFWETLSGEEYLTSINNDINFNDVSANHPGGTRMAGSLALVMGLEMSNYDITVLSPLLLFDWVAFDAASYSPDGTMFALSKVDGRVVVFENATYTQVMEVILPGGHTAMTFDPTNSLLAVADLRGGVTVLDVGTGQIRLTLPDQAAAVNALVYSPPGDLLATGTADGVVRLWEATGGTEVLELARHGSAVILLDFNQSGTRVISGSQDGVVRSSVVGIQDLLGLASQRVQRLFTAQEATRYRIDPEDISFASLPAPASPQPHTVELDPFPTQPPKEVHPPSQPSALISADNIDQVEELGWAEILATWPVVSPDGKTFVNSSSNLTFTLYDMETLKPIWQQKVDQVFNALAYSPDSAYLAVAGEDGLIHLLRTADGSKITVIEGHTSSLSALEFSPDGSLLVSSTGDDLILLHSIPDGTLVDVLGDDSGEKVGRLAVFSPDGRLLATGSGDGVVRIWDFESHQVLLEFQAAGGVPGPLDFSPDGFYLVTGDSSSVAGSRVWRLADGSMVAEFEKGGFPFFSPDGSMVFTMLWLEFDENGQNYARYYFWDPHDGALLHSIAEPGANVNGFFMTPDRRFFVTFDWFGRMHLYGVP